MPINFTTISKTFSCVVNGYYQLQAGECAVPAAQFINTKINDQFLPALCIVSTSWETAFRVPITGSITVQCTGIKESDALAGTQIEGKTRFRAGGFECWDQQGRLDCEKSVTEFIKANQPDECIETPIIRRNYNHQANGAFLVVCRGENPPEPLEPSSYEPEPSVEPPIPWCAPEGE